MSNDWTIVNTQQQLDDKKRIPARLAFKQEGNMLQVAAELQNDIYYAPRPGGPSSRRTMGFELMVDGLQAFQKDGVLDMQQYDSSQHKVGDFLQYTHVRIPLSANLTMKEVLNALQHNSGITVSNADRQMLSEQFNYKGMTPG